MANAWRYQLDFELHHRHNNNGTEAIRTVHRWNCTNSPTPRAIYVVLVNGIGQSRTPFVGQGQLDRLTELITQLTGRATAITDDQARTTVKELTGVEFPTWCSRADCGAPIPLGADRCAAGDSIGQVGGGSISGLHWVGQTKRSNP